MLNIIFYDNKMFYKIPINNIYYINDNYEVISIYNFKNIIYLQINLSDYMFDRYTHYSLTIEPHYKKWINKNRLLKLAKEELSYNRIKRERKLKVIKEISECNK